MMGDIDLTKIRQRPMVYLTKPDGTTVAKMQNFENHTLKWKLANTNELYFEVPYYIIRNHAAIINPDMVYMKERYLIKLSLNGEDEWYIIDKIGNKTDLTSTNTDVKTVTAYSLNYELTDKIIYAFDAEGINITTAMNGGTVTDSSGDTVTWNGILYNSLWSLGYVDSSFNSTYRTFSMDNVTALDATFKIAQTFNAVVVWDTVNRLINFYQAENYGTDRGLRISDREFLKTLEQDSLTDQMVTRLHVFGQNQLSINSVNPTGTDYIEDYSFFMDGYTTDANGNVTSDSPYMSQDLIQAILNYNNKVSQNKTTLSNDLSTLNTQQTQLTNDQNTLVTYQTQLSSAQDVTDTMKATTDQYFYYTWTYNGVEIDQTTTLNNTYYYVAMAKVSNISNITLTLDGTAVTMTGNNDWQVLGKINSGSTSSTLKITGSATNDSVYVQYNMISNTEYTTTGNEQALIQKYNVDYNQSLVNSQQTVVNNDQTAVNNTNTNIQNLQSSLAVENNFTADEIKEWNQFIIEKTWSDSTYTDAQTLYNDAVTRFADMHTPQLQFQINILNFLEVIEAQRVWDKLTLGDTITIDYSIFNDVPIKAKIIEVDFDFDKMEIALTIANVVDVRTGEMKYVDMLYQAVGTSTQVNMNKYKWDNAATTATQVNDIVTSAWDATKREITAGVNESVKINSRGITITESDNVNNMLIAQAGVLAISNDGGTTWKQAITSSGIVAEQIIGKLIIGEGLEIDTTDGSFTVNSDGVTVDGTKFTVKNGGIQDNQIASAPNWNVSVDTFYDGDFQYGERFWSDTGTGQTVSETTKGTVNTKTSDASQGNITLSFTGQATLYAMNALPIDPTRNWQATFRVRETTDATNGIQSPTVSPTLATSSSQGSLPSGLTYYVVYTWENANGETEASPEATIILPSGTNTNSITVTIPTLPSGITQANIYISSDDGDGSASGQETLQGNTTSATYSQTVVLTTNGAKAPNHNQLGNMLVYAGVLALDVNYNSLGTVFCAVNGLGVEVNDGWQVFVGTAMGTGTDGITTFPSGTAFVRPMFTVNSLNGNGTAEIDYLDFKDVTDISNLQTRMTNVELATTSDSIISTVTTSTEYQNDLNAKADSSNLANYATTDALTQAQQEANSYTDQQVANIDLTPYATTSYVDQTSTDLQIKLSNSGGVNLLKNSVGYKSSSFWTVTLDNVSDPTVAPTLSTSTTGGALSGATYYVVYTWVDSSGNETKISPEQNIVVPTTTTTNTITVTVPTMPDWAVKTNIYIGTASGGETLQGNATGTTYTQSSALTSGLAYPTSSTIVKASVGTVQNAELVAKGTGSGFQLYGALISQDITDSSTYHTISTLVNKGKLGSGYMTITYTDQNGVQQTNTTNFSSGVAYDYQSFSVTIETGGTDITIELYGTSDSGIIFTGTMVNVGQVALEWQQASGEVYNTYVTIDIDGIQVNNSNNNGYTSITPTEFAGYANVPDANGNPVMTKVFTVNEDTTEVHNLQVDNQFSMAPLQVIPVTSGGYNGWAFIAQE